MMHTLLTISALLLVTLSAGAFSFGELRKNTGIEIKITAVEDHTKGEDSFRLVTVKIHNTGKKDYWIGCHKSAKDSKKFAVGNKLGVAYHLNCQSDLGYFMYYRKDHQWGQDAGIAFVQAKTWKKFAPNDVITLRIPVENLLITRYNRVYLFVPFSVSGDLEGHFALASNGITMLPTKPRDRRQ